MNHRASVIIPTYRRDESLCLTLQSLFEQDCQDFEIVVVDQKPQHDAKTKDFLTRHAHRIRYISKDHANLPAARNTGIQESQGDIIIFTDDDMRLPPSTVSQLLHHYHDPRVSGLTGFVVLEQAGGTCVPLTHASHYWQRDRSSDLVKVDIVPGGFMSFRREAFTTVGLFDEWIGEQPTAAGEESDLCFRMRKAGLELYLVPGLVVPTQNLLSGGCEKSEYTVEQNAGISVKMAFYSYIKNRANDGWSGYLAAILYCYRVWVLNRSLLNLNPLFHWRRHRTYFQALRFALDANRTASSRHLRTHG